MKRVAMAMLLGLIMLAGCGAKVWAQDKDATKESAKATTSDDSANFYRLDFTLRELDGTKVVNKRTYSLNVRTGRNDWEQLRTGTRVPLTYEEQGGKHVQYFDVGVNLDCRASEGSRGISLEVRSDISSLPADSPATFSPGQGPMVRQVKNDSWVLIQTGKSAMLFTADEPATSRHFEMEVVATKL